MFRQITGPIKQVGERDSTKCVHSIFSGSVDQAVAVALRRRLCRTLLLRGLRCGLVCRLCCRLWLCCRGGCRRVDILLCWLRDRVCIRHFMLPLVSLGLCARCPPFAPQPIKIGTHLAQLAFSSLACHFANRTSDRFFPILESGHFDAARYKHVIYMMISTAPAIISASRLSRCNFCCSVITVPPSSLRDCVLARWFHRIKGHTRGTSQSVPETRASDMLSERPRSSRRRS